MPLNFSAAIARTGIIGLSFMLMSPCCMELDDRVASSTLKISGGHQSFAIITHLCSRPLYLDVGLSRSAADSEPI
jgi:hypothetical protein